MPGTDRLFRTMKGLLRLARIVTSSSDNKDFPIQQIEYLGKNCDATVWMPYGMHANLPPDVLAIAMSLNGNLETRYAFPSSPKKRLEDPLPNPLSEGELLLYNPTTQAYVYFKADGSITMNALAIEAGFGGTVQKLCNETFLTLFNAHVHSSGGSGIPTVAAVINTDTTTILKGE